MELAPPPVTYTLPGLERIGFTVMLLSKEVAVPSGVTCIIPSMIRFPVAESIV